MKKEIEKLLKEIANDSDVLDSDVLYKYAHSARLLLNAEFEEEVLAVFKCDIRAIAEGNFDVPKTVCAFIRYAYLFESQKEFLDNNFDRINEIYEIVISEIKNRKEEKK